jgi:hypothetical protein
MYVPLKVHKMCGSTVWFNCLLRYLLTKILHARYYFLVPKLQCQIHFELTISQYAVWTVDGSAVRIYNGANPKGNDGRVRHPWMVS